MRTAHPLKRERYYKHAEPFILETFGQEYLGFIKANEQGKNSGRP